MTRKILSPLLAALLMAAVVVGGSAIAAGKGTKTIKFQGVAHAHATGDGSNIAGNTKDKFLGNGAVVYKDAAAGTGVKIPFTSFTKNGSYSGKATADTTINPDATLTISNCTLKITSGGGAFKGATGKGTCSGNADKNQNFTVNYKGSVKVPK